MGNRLDGVRRKTERAKHHIRDLDARIGDFCGKHPYKLGAKPHRIPILQYTTLYVESVQSIPGDIPPIVGDAVHNLRSSLDHLIWQLVEIGGGTPNKDTYFPICVDPMGGHKFATACGKGEMKLIPQGSREVLLSVQPYISREDTLWHIHELDRNDKHRVLITALIAFDQWRIELGRGQCIWFDEGSSVPIEPGYEIVSIPTGTYEGQPHENYKLATDITFAQSEIVGGQPVLKTLNEMAIFVDDIIGRFEPYLI